MSFKPLIIGIEGHKLLQSEIDFIGNHQPWGFILFARNIDSPCQVRDLVASLKDSVKHENVPVLIDQEGGRVSRLSSKYWKQFKDAKFFGDIVESQGIDKACDLVKTNFTEIAEILNDLGINVDCAPLIDIRNDGADDIIGDRAFSDNKDIVSKLGKAACDGLIAGGVLPVIKHIPGHGRANCDSHKELPVVNTSLDVLKAEDFIPFKALNEMPMAMTAHIKYTEIDNNHCATMSTTILDAIRKEIGFDGIIMTDDLSMKALEGSFEDRAINSLKAGCDVVLHCNGEMDEMDKIANAIKAVSEIEINKFEKMWNLL